MTEDTWYPYSRQRVRHRGYLPHWEADNSIYFVTLHLADSLPASVLAEYQAEREAHEASLLQSGRTPAEAKQHAGRELRKRAQEYLDGGRGACYLARPAVAEMVAGALGYFDGERYRLHAWCIMPNHLHLVLSLLPDHTLGNVVENFKRYTARQANKLIGRQGALWQREGYDSIIRSQKQYHHVLEYVAGNPVRAGLQKWQRVWRAEFENGERDDAT